MEALDGGQRFVMDVCCENQNGSQVLVGSATGVLSAPNLPRSQPAGRAGFHTRDETFFYNPARVGKKFRVTWDALDGYEKRGRLYSVNKTSIVDQDGLEILRRFSHGTVASQEYRTEKSIGSRYGLVS